MYINYNGSEIIYGELISGEQRQYLRLLKENESRRNGILFSLVLLSLSLFYLYR